MNYLSYNILSLFTSSSSSSHIHVNDDDDPAEEAASSTSTVSINDEMRHTDEFTNNAHRDIYDKKKNLNGAVTIIPINRGFIPRISACSSNALPDSGSSSSIDFQIQSTIQSWSFCWNRGDIIGYCDSYYRTNTNPATETTRYISVSRHGKMTYIEGTTNITNFLTRVFEQCIKLQSKVIPVQQESVSSTTSTTLASSNNAVAGYLEYSNLQIQYMPSVVTNHAIVFGQYTLEFSPNTNVHNERGIFTLHLIQVSSSLSTKWQIQSEHSSALELTS